MDLVGKTLGNYRIDRLLGEGGMGTVYQAYDLALQRDAAIKLIHPHLARQPAFRERFVQEARLMARLDHPGIVKVYALGKEGELLFLPMEFIKGGNVRQLLDKLIQERRWIPLDEAVLLIQQLCQVVEYAHKQGVLHRDIKPANLMLKPEPTEGLPFRVVLTDLGLAKLLEGLGMTQEGTSLGTPAYMSPEQASGKLTDARSDVYSLGILLYELTVGRLPFLIRSITEATRYHTQELPPAPRSLRPELPESVEQVILKALEKEPHNRYPSAAALRAALAGGPGSSTEIIDPNDPGTVSLVTEYQNSVIASPPPAAASLMTVLGDEPTGPRGSSVFDGQSVPPGRETRIQVISREQTAKVFTLPPGTVTIGRGKENHIVLDDDRASRRHAQITWDGMEYHLMDLNSSNGTFLENSRLLPGMSEILKPGQNLRIGDTWLRIIQPDSRDRSLNETRSMIGSTSRFIHSSAGIVGVTVTPQQLSVEPGGVATATLSLLNQSPNVDHFSLSLTGIPSAWVASLPDGVHLMPGEQKETAFALQVPRVPQSSAGPHPIKVKVTSQRDPGQFVEVKLTLTVAAFSQFRIELQPERLRSGQIGRMTISNQGNLQELFTIQFKDAANELAFEPPQLQMRVLAGASAATEYRVRESKLRIIGGEKTHSFSAQVSLPKGEAQALRGELRSRGLIPVWVPPLIFLVCLGLVSAATLLLGARQSSNQAAQTATFLISDLDNDGLSYEQEAAFHCNPDKPDSDGDGLSDVKETEWDTNCVVLDSDYDNLLDGDEVLNRGTHPRKSDTDGDGLQDDVDPDPGAPPSFTPSPTAVTPSATLIAPSGTPVMPSPIPTLTPSLTLTPTFTPTHTSTYTPSPTFTATPRTYRDDHVGWAGENRYDYTYSFTVDDFIPGRRYMLSAKGMIPVISISCGETRGSIIVRDPLGGTASLGWDHNDFFCRGGFSGWPNHPNSGLSQSQVDFVNRELKPYGRELVKNLGDFITGNGSYRVEWGWRAGCCGVYIWDVQLRPVQ